MGFFKLFQVLSVQCPGFTAVEKTSEHEQPVYPDLIKLVASLFLWVCTLGCTRLRDWLAFLMHEEISLSSESSEEMMLCYFYGHYRWRGSRASSRLK